MSLCLYASDFIKVVAAAIETTLFKFYMDNYALCSEQRRIGCINSKRLGGNFISYRNAYLKVGFHRI